MVNAVTSKWAKGTGGPSGDECQNLVAVWTKAKRAQSVDDNEISLTETMGALGRGGGKPGQGNATVLTVAAVRRLTPVECERLMGWPDNHTAVGVTDSGDIVQLADSPRYRMIGNGVASPVAAWIGRHLLAVDGAE